MSLEREIPVTATLQNKYSTLCLGCRLQTLVDHNQKLRWFVWEITSRKLNQLKIC
ncbi:hypothetical protein SCLCIDRAFT_1217871 [Scleroderma citrinum Foug A]|uniref:Uncharacterized protein n=1 Tax=Scleroderma citrinum Foug A TaxID=1036808 RepID=A0A0C3DF22_9AGAM|nr:hypothetical protein SCLCIDRAFT_1217871 [Scleroderma citrinum Foug A]